MYYKDPRVEVELQTWAYCPFKGTGKKKGADGLPEWDDTKEELGVDLSTVKCSGDWPKHIDRAKITMELYYAIRKVFDKYNGRGEDNRKAKPLLADDNPKKVVPMTAEPYREDCDGH